MPNTKEIERLQARGLKLLEELNDMFAGSLSSDDKGKGNPLNATSTLSTSDRAFIKTILTSGTETDKLSALILLSSSSPIHTTSYLNQLQGLTKKKSRDQAVRAIRAIVDWLQGGSAGTSSAGLPDRKLKWFNEQADLRRVVYAQKTGLKKNGKQPGDEQLVAWAFEDWLKKWYFSLLQVIEGLLHDPLPFVRTQMTGFIASLLSGKPEQEQNLLRLLIDKLADSDKSVSSRTSHHILQVIQSHPMMKGIVVREVAALVLKPSTVNSASNASHPIASKKGQKGKGPTSGGLSHAAGLRSSDHSRYYGIITLNQIMLSRSDQDKVVANKLLETYFSVFQDLLGTYTTNEDDAEALPQHGELKDRKRRRDEKNGKGRKDEDKLKDLSRQDRRKVLRSQQALESESKLMAAVLTGVNRAFPYSDLEGDV
jgi:ribosome biogenesis protein MAK21